MWVDVLTGGQTEEEPQVWSPEFLPVEDVFKDGACDVARQQQPVATLLFPTAVLGESALP